MDGCGWMWMDIRGSHHGLEVDWTTESPRSRNIPEISHSEESNTWQYLHHGEYGRCRGRSGGCEAHVVDITLKHPARALFELFSRYVSCVMSHACVQQEKSLQNTKTDAAIQFDWFS